MCYLHIDCYAIYVILWTMYAHSMFIMCLYTQQGKKSHQKAMTMTMPMPQISLIVLDAVVHFNF